MRQKEILVLTSFDVLFDAVLHCTKYGTTKAVEENKGVITSAMKATPTDISYYVNSLAKKKGWRTEKMANFLNNLLDINPGAAFQAVLREIAIELDKKYEDHIEKSNKIFCVSMANGHIFEANKKHIRNFRNFAAFRTLDDAKLACKITRHLLKDMFKSGRK